MLVNRSSTRFSIIKTTLLERLRYLRHLIDFKPIPVIFSSTCATYGNPETSPISEDHPQRPVNPYGFSKLIVERMLADLGAAYGLRSISLRYFNARAPILMEKLARRMILNLI